MSSLKLNSSKLIAIGGNSNNHYCSFSPYNNLYYEKGYKNILKR